MYILVILIIMQPASSDKQKIVIIEDNEQLAEIYKTRLEIIGYECHLAYNGITGLYHTQVTKPDLVLLDMMIPDIAGDEVLRILRKTDWGHNIKVIVISNLNESSVPASLRELGISDYAVKANMTEDDIDTIVNKVLRPAPAGSAEAMQQQSGVPAIF